MAMRDVTPWNQRGSHLRRSGGLPGDFNSLFNTLHDQIERAFNNVWGGLESPFGDGRRALAATDISETEDGYEICVELPGFDEKDIDVSVDDESLVIKAETSQETKEEEKKGYVYSERRRGSVYRTLPLPPTADLEKITGAFQNGVLTIKVPKSERAKQASRKISLSSGQQSSAQSGASRSASGPSASGQAASGQSTSGQTPSGQAGKPGTSPGG